MKRVLLSLLLIGITFLSCTQNSDDSIISTNYSGSSLNLLSEELQTSCLIDGEKGGQILFEKDLVDNEGNNISVNALLRFLPNSFSGVKNITMVLNTDDASIQFFPSMTFNRSVRLDLSFEGIGLERLGYTSNRDVEFVYFNDHGSIEQIQNTLSKVKINQDLIRVQNAKLFHFSRYGWVR
jgi:hypothetical protein